MAVFWVTSMARRLVSDEMAKLFVLIEKWSALPKLTQEESKQYLPATSEDDHGDEVHPTAMLLDKTLLAKGDGLKPPTRFRPWMTDSEQK